ncbi:MAG: hypothetical protein MOGMAGMI_01319 [Candidatus Omnitrophica bacterium]|nr:hypothetical protein [Candidatus Omnitrophota bacterium]
MFVLANLLNAMALVLGLVLKTYWWLLVIRALLSWVSPDPSNPIVQFIYNVTEPVLRPLRAWIPVWKIGIDVSVFIAILIIYFLEIFLVQTLIGLAVRLG